VATLQSRRIACRPSRVGRLWAPWRGCPQWRPRWRPRWHSWWHSRWHRPGSSLVPRGFVNLVARACAAEQGTDGDTGGAAGVLGGDEAFELGGPGAQLCLQGRDLCLQRCRALVQLLAATLGLVGAGRL